MEGNVVVWSVVKGSEGLSNRMSNIIIIYIYMCVCVCVYVCVYVYHTKFAVYMALLFITFFHILSVPLFSVYIWLYVCMRLFIF